MSHRKSGGVRTNFSPVPRGRGPLLTSVFPILYHKVVFAGLRVLNRACVANPPTLPCPLAGSRGRAGPGGGTGRLVPGEPPPPRLATASVQGVGRGGSGENLRGFPAGAAGGGAGEGGGLVCRVRAGSSASDRMTHVQTRARVSAGPLSVCGTGERAGTRVLLTRPTRRPLHPCHGQGHRGQGDELPHPARKQ